MDLIRNKSLYTLDKVEIAINRLEFALECLVCNSMKCEHVIIIWKIKEEEEYLRELGFLNPISRIL